MSSPCATATSGPLIKNGGEGGGGGGWKNRGHMKHKAIEPTAMPRFEASPTGCVYESPGVPVCR